MDIEITRSGKWEVQVDGVVTSSHNEAKEGYENLIEQKLNNPDSVVELIPNFKVTATTDQTAPTEPPFSLSEAEVEAAVKDIPLFEAGKEYQYVIFELDNGGLKNFSQIKTVII